MYLGFQYTVHVLFHLLFHARYMEIPNIRFHNSASRGEKTECPAPTSLVGNVGVLRFSANTLLLKEIFFKDKAFYT